MTATPGYAVERIHRDHDYLLELLHRIEMTCRERDRRRDCRSCADERRQVCQGDVEQLIVTFTEVLLKHQVVESIYMEDAVPAEHRLAHQRSHLALAEALKAIRVVFSADGNCVVAIEGIDRVLAMLKAHIVEFDAPLENFLLAPA